MPQAKQLALMAHLYLSLLQAKSIRQITIAKAISESHYGWTISSRFTIPTKIFSTLQLHREDILALVPTVQRFQLETW